LSIAYFKLGVAENPRVHRKLSIIKSYRIKSSDRQMQRGVCRLCPRPAGTGEVRKRSGRDQKKFDEQDLPKLTDGHYLYHTERDIKEIAIAAKLSPFVPRTLGKAAGTIRFVVFSDTHAEHRRIHLPPGDVLIHAGDITANYGRKSLPTLENTFEDFLDYMRSLKQFKLKIFIAGNHDINLHTDRYKEYKRSKKLIRMLPKDIVYLEHSFTEFKGMKIWGSPACSSRLEISNSKYYSDAFEIHSSKRKKIWKGIPEGLDVLITHIPPSGTMDESEFFHPSPSPLGDPILAKSLLSMKVPPRVHVFGHCHRGAGVRGREKGALAINASMTGDIRGSPDYFGIARVFDLPIVSKK